VPETARPRILSPFSLSGTIPIDDFVGGNTCYSITVNSMTNLIDRAEAENLIRPKALLPSLNLVEVWPKPLTKKHSANLWAIHRLRRP
jgi:hypothetical protein